MSGDFKIHIRHEGHEYQIDLASTSPDKAEVRLDGIGYSVRPSPQSAKIRQLFLEQATLPTSTTMEGLLKNVRHLASVEEVSVTSTQKTHEVGLSHLAATGASALSSSGSAAVSKAAIFLLFLLKHNTRVFVGAFLRQMSVQNLSILPSGES